MGCFDLERERLLLSCRRRDGLGDADELLELEEREELELPDLLEAEDELEPLLEPELEPELELEEELERLLLLLPVEVLRRLRVLSLPRSLSPDSLVAGFSLGRSLDLSSERSLRFVGEGAIFLPRPEPLCLPDSAAPARSMTRSVGDTPNQRQVMTYVHRVRH